MLLRFIQESLLRAPRRKILLVAAIAMGSAVATAMLGVMLSIGDKVNQELRAVGANIAVTKKSQPPYFAEADALKVKQIFWALNITAYSPSLTTGSVQGVWFNQHNTGIRALNPAWKVTGVWARDNAPQCMAGENLARRNHWQPGATINVLNQTCQLTGIISAGDEVDDRVLLPLALVQKATSHPGQIDRIDVAALTKPEDDFARKDPKTMTAAEFERWNCTNYVASIAHEIEEAIPGTQAHPVRRVADSEGKVLGKIGGLMVLITLAALLSAGLTVWSLTAATLLERRAEIAIMQAIGGTRLLIATILGLEITLIAAVGGTIGAAIGLWLATFVGQSVFNGPVDISPVLPPVIVLSAILVGLAGAAQPLSSALSEDPAPVLREGV